VTPRSGGGSWQPDVLIHSRLLPSSKRDLPAASSVLKQTVHSDVPCPP
jgi:hypothetical protein